MKRTRRISIVLAVAISLVLAAAVAHATPNITGRWRTDDGKIYVITQMGSAFTWRMPETGQTGFGNIDEYTATAVWPFGSAEGRITVNSVDRGIRIDWNNGVVFTRPGGGGGEEPGGEGEAPPADLAADWTLIGSQAREIIAGGDKLFGIRSDTGDLYEYSGSGIGWRRIGTAGSSHAVDGNGRIYRIDSAGVWRYSGSGTTWDLIRGPSARLYAGGRNLFATDPETGDIYQYDGTPDSWRRVGGSGITFAVTDTGFLYGISPSGVFRYDGPPAHWTQIGPAASNLFAGGNRLFRTDTSSGDLYQYNGSPNSWTRIGGSGITFTVDGNGQVYGLSASGVFRYEGTPERWTQIGGPGADIEAGRSDLFGITADGDVWRFNP